MPDTHERETAKRASCRVASRRAASRRVVSSKITMMARTSRKQGGKREHLYVRTHVADTLLLSERLKSAKRARTRVKIACSRRQACSNLSARKCLSLGNRGRRAHLSEHGQCVKDIRYFYDRPMIGSLQRSRSLQSSKPTRIPAARSDVRWSVRWRGGGTKGIGSRVKICRAKRAAMNNVVVAAERRFHGGTSKRAVPGKGPLRGGPTT